MHGSPGLRAVIETDQLTKRYGTSRGIEDVSIAVDRGEVYGFLGPNGAGKTTTIRTLLDLLHPTRGRALLFGLDSRAASLEIRARLGNLPGDFSIAMGVAGATVSSETADAVITIDRIDRVADAVHTGRRSLHIARQSVLAGMGLSLTAMAVAAAGYLQPVAGALFQEVIDLAVILNALRALRG